ncbi:MAG: type-F conjugative transfer system secretin TraK, partial [Rhodospirillaceae bacterium]|nr:type-F conjugative transfer system secretin TraK [Rhodospirillaceae bacterium]
TVEHDPVRGDLYLYPGGSPVPSGTSVLGRASADHNAPALVTLYVGTEQGFTYRLSLTAVARDSAQILIRNRALAHTRVDRDASTPGAHESEMAALVRAVATRNPLPGYVIVPVPNVDDGAGNTGGTGWDVSLVELWRGPRYSARVLSVRADAELDASGLAESYGPGAVAGWLEPSPVDGGTAGGNSGSTTLGARLAVVVEETASAEGSP